MRRAHHLYRVQLLVGGVGLALLAFVGVAVFGSLSLSVPSARAIQEACNNWLSAGGPAAALSLGLGALALAVVWLALRSGQKQVLVSNRYLASLPILDETVEVEGLRCRLVDLPGPQAFCAGYLRPRMYLSLGALDQLTKSELRAVLAHEAHHLRRRDPLRLLLARTLADALFFVPILRRISDRYSALAEIAADEAAVRALRDRGPLASALLKFSERGAVPAAVAGIAPERVDHLMGDPRAGHWQLPPSPLGRSAVALLALGGASLLLWHGVLNPTMELPLLLAAGCMTLFVGGPLVLAYGSFVLVRRARHSPRGA